MRAHAATYATFFDNLRNEAGCHDSVWKAVLGHAQHEVAAAFAAVADIVDILLYIIRREHELQLF